LFRVLGPGGVSSFASGEAALAFAETSARDLAEAAVRQLGADQPQVHVSISKSHLPDAVDDNGMLEAVVRAEAIGRPSTA
jgi:hypothetical protein